MIHNVVGISFSHAKNSMNTRGLKLMGLDDVYDMSDFNMPICNVNKSDGKVLVRVHNFLNRIKEADILVFAVPEATAHYSAGFKNAMDWIICATNFNADLGQDGPFSNKPIYVITFTPVISNAGDRHFDMTKHLIEKMGGIVYNSFVKHNGWKECIPGNYNWVKKECDEIKNTQLPEPINRKKDMLDRPNIWIEQYNEWDNKWRNNIMEIDGVKVEKGSKEYKGFNKKGLNGLFYLNKERTEYGDCLPFDLPQNGKAILCGVPGAFTPGCTNNHLPGFAKGLDLLKPYGIEKVIFYAVNDAMVMDAWNNIHGHPDILAVSDPLAVFSKNIDEDVDFGETFGIRCNRSAYLIENGELVHKFKDPFFDGVLEELKENVV